MRTTSQHRLALLVGACLALGLAGAVKALDEVSLEIATLRGAMWSADDIRLRFQLSQRRARASIARLRVGPKLQTLRDVQIDCPRLEVSDGAFLCRQAKMAAVWPALGPQAVTVDVRYGRKDRSLEVAVQGIRLAGGTAEIAGALRQRGWSARVFLQRIPFSSLRGVVEQLDLSAGAYSAEGLITLSASARGRGDQLQHAEVDATLRELTANNTAGSIASDKLSARAQLSLHRITSGWQFALNLDAPAGQAYVQPLFVDFGAYPLKVAAQGQLRGTQLMLERFALEHLGTARASGHATLQLGQPRPVRSMHLHLQQLQFPGAYINYLQPLLLDTSLKAASTAGSLAGDIVIDEGLPSSINLQLDGLSLDAGARSFALRLLSGQWHWRAQNASQGDLEAAELPGVASKLSWHGGSLFGMQLGGGQLEFLSSGRHFRLLQPSRIPILDGAVRVESFRIRNAGLPSVAFIVDAALEPLSVGELCRAFGWPQFGGRVAGTLSKLRMREGVVRLGANLQAQVFDGRVTIRDLKLEQPFGQWPRLSSSIALDNLDLELLTRAFSFGRITGRLSGAIDGLRLFNWAPVAFDARFYTPAGDRSKHRISQRAVRNLGSIGGSGAGVTAALSGSLLRFFEDFNYARLGLSCRLENEVCIMEGVAPAPNGGYYLVQGRGLPRIDVIGSARRVDWPRLVQQLVAATRSQGPVVGPPGGP